MSLEGYRVHVMHRKGRVGGLVGEMFKHVATGRGTSTLTKYLAMHVLNCIHTRIATQYRLTYRSLPVKVEAH